MICVMPTGFELPEEFQRRIRVALSSPDPDGALAAVRADLDRLVRHSVEMRRLMQAKAAEYLVTWNKPEIRFAELADIVWRRVQDRFEDVPKVEPQRSDETDHIYAARRACQQKLTQSLRMMTRTMLRNYVRRKPEQFAIVGRNVKINFVDGDIKRRKNGEPIINRYTGKPEPRRRYDHAEWLEFLVPKLISDRQLRRLADEYLRNERRRAKRDSFQFSGLANHVWWETRPRRSRLVPPKRPDENDAEFAARSALQNVAIARAEDRIKERLREYFLSRPEAFRLAPSGMLYVRFFKKLRDGARFPLISDSDWKKIREKK